MPETAAKQKSRRKLEALRRDLPDMERGLLGGQLR
jgi:hypothetical protein